MFGQIEVVRATARQFCLQFIKEPYLSYTEHGLHALFFTMLYNNLSDNQALHHLGGPASLHDPEGVPHIGTSWQVQETTLGRGNHQVPT